MRRLLLAGMLALTGCGPAADDPAGAGVSESEAAALNDAATMLDEANATVIANEAEPENAE